MSVTAPRSPKSDPSGGRGTGYGLAARASRHDAGRGRRRSPRRRRRTGPSVAPGHVLEDIERLEAHLVGMDKPEAGDHQRSRGMLEPVPDRGRSGREGPGPDPLRDDRDPVRVPGDVAPDLVHAPGRVDDHPVGEASSRRFRYQPSRAQLARDHLPSPRPITKARLDLLGVLGIPELQFIADEAVLTPETSAVHGGGSPRGRSRGASPRQDGPAIDRVHVTVIVRVAHLVEEGVIVLRRRVPVNGR